MMRFFWLILLGCVPSLASAQSASPFTPFLLTAPTYTQNFNTLVSMGTSNVMPAGFQIVETGDGAAADGFYQVGTGSNAGGNAYNFGLNGNTDRALGALTSGGVSSIMLGAVFTNGLGATVTSVGLDFFGEQWRAAEANLLSFEYSTDATNLLDGTWIRASSFDFAALVVTPGAQSALNGNLAANRRQITGTIGGLSIANGGRFGLRWTQRDVQGSDPGLAIDDLTLRLVASVPEPATWSLLIMGFGFVGASLRRARSRGEPGVLQCS